MKTRITLSRGDGASPEKFAKIADRVTLPEGAPARGSFWPASVVARRIEIIAASARGLLHVLKSNSTNQGYSEAARAAVEALHTCTAMNQGPPEELVALVRLLLICEGLPRKRKRHSLIAEIRAAKHLALNPTASNRTVARIAGVNDKTVAEWKSKPASDFRKLTAAFKAQAQAKNR